MARYFKKRKTNDVIKAIFGVILVIALGVGAVALMSNMNGILNNKDNLVHTLEEYEGKSGTDGNGLLWTVNSDGSVRCKGEITNEDLDEVEFVIGTIKIETEDSYTLSGAPEGSKSTFFIKAEYEDEAGNLKTVYSDFNGECTTLEKLPVGTEVKITIVVKSGVAIDQTFKPTFVAGEKAGEF